MYYSQPVTDLIRKRVSCRHYLQTPIEEGMRRSLQGFLSELEAGPFGTAVRFTLIAATERERSELRGLGTYGFIQGASGFIVGAVGPGEKNLEDYGYLMERAVLYATDLGLGTCWLGGTFTKSRFARKIGARRGEQVPAVTATGTIAGKPYAPDVVARAVAGSDRRLPWEALFFDSRFDAPLRPEAAGAYATPLEMVRLGPSASNKQPWRIVREGAQWNFCLQRARLYRPRTLGLVGVADMPRLDLGIAMCHFELSARELGLSGAWQVVSTGMARADERVEYVVTWIEAC
jgi:nitroreductase